LFYFENRVITTERTDQRETTIMASEAILLEAANLAQAAQLNGLAGKSFVVGSVSSMGAGTGKWLALDPVGGAGSGSFLVKLEGTRQAAQISGLAGKTVTMGKAPVVIGGVGKWVALIPGMGVAGAGTGAGTVMMQVEGARAAGMGLAGKTFTVVQPSTVAAQGQNWLYLKPTAAATGKGGTSLIALKMQDAAGGNLSSLIGKTVTVSKGPIAAGGAGEWIVLNPVGAGAAKGATTATAAGWAKGATGVKSAGSMAAKGAGGSIFTGTGVKLGLGLGLGAWGPALLLGAIGLGVYGYIKSKSETEAEDLAS
jgi:hypothetical protein